MLLIQRHLEEAHLAMQALQCLQGLVVAAALLLSFAPHGGHLTFQVIQQGADFLADLGIILVSLPLLLPALPHLQQVAFQLFHLGLLMRGALHALAHFLGQGLVLCGQLTQLTDQLDGAPGAVLQGLPASFQLVELAAFSFQGKRGGRPARAIGAASWLLRPGLPEWFCGLLWLIGALPAGVLPGR